MHEVATVSMGNGALLERDAELAALRTALERARDGDGSVVVIEGEAGIGKSALLGAAREMATAQESVVLAAHGSELESAYAFGLARQLFEGHDAHTLDALFSAPPDAASRGSVVIVRRIFDAIVTLTRRLPGRGVVLAIDDTQWSDEPTLRLLAYLALRLDGLPIALLTTIRTGEMCAPEHRLADVRGTSRAAVLRPAPLGREAIADVVRATLGWRVDDTIVAACAKATSGNGFYLRELLRVVQELGPQHVTPEVVERLAPRSVLHSILVRLARLGTDAAQLARAIAVLGDGAPIRLGAALAQLDRPAAERAADALARAAVLVAGEPLRFRHPVIASTLAADMGHFERARANKAAAWLLLAERGPVALVAAHLLRASPAGDERAVEILRTAAADAIANGDPTAAARLLARAVEEHPPGDVRPQLVIELAKAEALAGEPGAAERLEAALAILPSGALRADALAELATLLHLRGDFGRVVELARRARGELAVDDGGHERLLAIELAAATLHPDMQAESAAAMQPLIAQTRAGKPPANPSLLALVVGRMGAAEDPSAVCAAARAAIAGDPLIDGSHGESVGWVACALIWCDKLSLAEDWLTEVLAVADRQGRTIVAAVAALNRSTARHHAGRLDLAIADAERALDFHRRGWTSSPWSIPVLVATHVARGDGDAARAALEVGERVGGDPPDHALLLEARAQLHLLEGDADAALAAALAAGHHIEVVYRSVQPRLWSWRRLAARAALALGRSDEARELIAPDVAALRTIGPGRQLGAALTIAGLATGGDEGVALLREATVVLEDSPSRLQRAASVLELGAALRRAGQRSAAKEQLLVALELAHEIGADPLEQRARMELRTLGLRPRRAARSGPGSLTPSELRVATLAASGLSTPEIARQLYITRNTVETHLGHAYRKLDVTSRRQLPGALEQP